MDVVFVETLGFAALVEDDFSDFSDLSIFSDLSNFSVFTLISLESLELEFVFVVVGTESLLVAILGRALDEALMLARAGDVDLDPFVVFCGD